ncbi:MAG: hypothetical protein A2W22_02620 [Candidatus Levybacteria bacterium RBG_16_35_11]|nr:MAG: hypothetical protein A2W22_02620 [Candidatus Levybacteria bacterium RBG_16_35_11]
MKHREIYILLISSFVLVVFWIAFSIYHNSVTSTITPMQNVQIIPIEPTFNSQAISNIKTRPEATPLYQLENIGEESVSPTPSATPGGILEQ